MTNLYLVKNFKVYTTKIVSLILFVVVMFALTGCGSKADPADPTESTPTRKYHTTSTVLTTDEVEYNSVTDEVTSPEALRGKSVTDKTTAYKAGVNYFISEPDIIYCADDVITCTHSGTFLGTTNKSDSATTATIENRIYGVVASGGTGDWTGFESVAGNQIYDWITVAGENHWVHHIAVYPTSADRPSVNGKLVGGIQFSAAEFNLLRVMGISAPFDLNMMIGDNDKLYLFTKTIFTHDFTFNLLFVKGNGYIKVDDVEYDGEGYTGLPNKVHAGDKGGYVYYNVDLTLSADMKEATAIYMVVTMYHNDSVVQAKKNVIRIK